MILVRYTDKVGRRKLKVIKLRATQTDEIPSSQLDDNPNQVRES